MLDQFLRQITVKLNVENRLYQTKAKQNIKFVNKIEGAINKSQWRKGGILRDFYLDFLKIKAIMN